MGYTSGIRGLAFSPSSPNLLFVTNSGYNYVSVIDTTTNTGVATIAVGGQPSDVVFGLDGAYAYVANDSGSSVSVIDTATRTVVATIGTGAYMTALTLTPDGAHVYAISRFSPRMYVIDTATNAVVSWYPLNGVLPSTIAAFPWSAPVVTGVEPSSGPVTGGNTVTVTGNRLNKATITFGAAGPASGVSCTTTSCSATAPPGPLGVVDLQLSTPGGTVAAGQYTHLPVPVVTSVSPSSGPVAGGTTVTITGTDLEDATEVTFGPGRRATDLVCTATSCSVTAPAGPAGTVHVQVISPTGTSATNDADRYTYLPPPVVTAIHPDRGPTTGGTTVTITGTNLADATAITFGPGNTATDVSCTATSCTAVAPPGTGTVQVRVTTAGGTSGSAQYTYNDSPVVTAVSPNAGPAAGGNTVTITGTNLAGATGITFGSGNNATDVSCTAILCTAVAPAGNAGDVHVQVTTPGGTSATSDADRYTYVSAPTVTAVSPNTGPLAGGNTVTITGTDLAGATITFGSGNNATDVSCTATSCTAVAPTGNAGDVHVQATTIGGTSATSVDNQYTYVPVPTVTAVTPDAGPTAGGNTVTITGTDLAGATAVTFGSGNNGTDVSCTATLCTAVAPAGSAGEVHVQVTTPGGTSATSDADRYTYVSAPTVTAVSPNAGPLAGGNTVTITGTDLAGATITFGSGNNAHRRVLHHHLLHRCRSDRKRWRRSRASHHARRNQRHQRRQPVHLRAGACGDRDPPRRWPRSRR
ncbi:IPT/TIG domain-containing protein [Polymorphospora sp. A560]|uniref:IPT/TIG domain-containing protein n=1 Tax=Polymorphospora sp. A560 TaxID=3040203 RepID=UPI0038919043